MTKLKLDLSNLNDVFPKNFTQEQIAKAKTLFLKRLAESAHRFYGGKIQTAPKAGVFGFNWFNIWYTPGVSKISTTIRDNNDTSFELTNRGNLVAVISDSTRVLGDGDVTPPGGMGVMEGKAFLMKYLGGVDALALCVDSRNRAGDNDPEKLIEFVKMSQHSFGAVNLEDISQPNCYRVLDVLREECVIPVWHDDAQGTACVTLAGLLNALKLVHKKLSEVKIVYFGAGAANTSCARIIIAAGGNPENMIMFDIGGALSIDREDFRSDPRWYRGWDLCRRTNPRKIKDIEVAVRDADVLIALSKPGPDTLKPEWIRSMAPKPIVFACANPVPEIWPYAAKEAGAYIVATGRGDFPNQVNNSLGFPGILKGALMVRARKVTDEMAIAAANSLALYAEKRGLTPENIIPKMNEPDVFPCEAADVAMKAIKDGVARKNITREEAYQWAQKDITTSRQMFDSMVQSGFVKEPPDEMIQGALDWAIKQV